MADGACPKKNFSNNKEVASYQCLFRAGVLIKLVLPWKLAVAQNHFFMSPRIV
jgi:hypothetical protein